MENNQIVNNLQQQMDVNKSTNRGKFFLVISIILTFVALYSFVWDILTIISKNHVSLSPGLVPWSIIPVLLLASFVLLLINILKKDEKLIGVVSKLFLIIPPIFFIISLCYAVSVKGFDSFAFKYLLIPGAYNTTFVFTCITYIIYIACVACIAYAFLLGWMVIRFNENTGPKTARTIVISLCIFQVVFLISLFYFPYISGLLRVSPM